MAKNKKRKPSSKMPHSTLKLSISKAQFDTGCAVARKMLRLLGYDPELFNMLSKKQKHALLEFETPVPVIRVKNGNRVPRQYLNNVRTSVLNFMRTNYVDEEVKLTYMELFTYGTPFLCAAKIKHLSGLFTAEQEKTFIVEMLEKFVSKQMNDIWFTKLYAHLWFELSFYSQVNFRTYGFTITADIPKPRELIGTAALRFIIELISCENESIHFVHNNIKRKAYAMLIGNTFLPVPPPAIILHKTLFPGSKSSAEYKIYVQSHAIHRFKERIDIVNAGVRNHLISLALTIKQKIVKSINGRNLISCCVNGVSFGYFPFTVQDDKLFVLSFLPFVDQITPEGAKLYSILNLSKDELIYLGMDKLSFYVNVDFDGIPILKNALIESGIWEIKKELDEGIDGEQQTDKVQTQFVKSFFQKNAIRKVQILSENMAETEISEEWND